MVIGYLFTIAYIALLLGVVVSAFILRKTLVKRLLESTTKTYIALALLVVLFFVVFSSIYVHPVEQLYFDETIYQEIALSIMHTGNALWCQYGTAYLNWCEGYQIYHDPVEISFYLAIFFFLFGISSQTAYVMSLMMGALSIVLVFTLGTYLLGKRAGLASAVVFALIPELFIWSRTQAIPNMLLMVSALLAFNAYVIYERDKNSTSLALMLFSLGIAVYSRAEAVLLIPVIIVIITYSSLVANGLKKGISRLLASDNIRNLLIILLFFVIILPEIYYVMGQVRSPDYGNGYICGAQSNATFSIGNLKCNIVPNVNFFLGAFTALGYYPTYFSIITTIAALIGAGLMLYKGTKKGFPFVLLAIWIVAFHLLYDAFYAGSVNFGVDVRFMLILYPPIALFAGFGIASISEGFVSHIAYFNKKKNIASRRLMQEVVFIALIVVFAVLPFYNAISIITVSPSRMPQQAMALGYMNFVNQNVHLVPNNCLVYTFDPDVWVIQNRSAIEISYLQANTTNSSAFASKFSCFVFDQGYWCTTPEFRNSTCNSGLQKYNPRLIVGERSPNGVDNYSLYYITRNPTNST